MSLYKYINVSNLKRESFSSIFVNCNGNSMCSSKKDRDRLYDQEKRNLRFNDKWLEDDKM